jgi:hypothetical protein
VSAGCRAPRWVQAHLRGAHQSRLLQARDGFEGNPVDDASPAYRQTSAGLEIVDGQLTVHLPPTSVTVLVFQRADGGRSCAAGGAPPAPAVSVS